MSALPPILGIALVETRDLVRRRRALRAAARGFLAGASLASFFALVMLAAALVDRYAAGGRTWPFSLVLALAVLPPAAGLVLPLLFSRPSPRSEGEAAMLLDRWADTQNRMATAVEFWRLPSRTPFQEAAIQQGLAAATGVDPFRVVGEGAGGTRWRRGLLRLLPALLCLGGVALLPPAALPAGAGGDRSLPRAGLPGPGKGGEREKPTTPPGMAAGSRRGEPPRRAPARPGLPAPGSGESVRAGEEPAPAADRRHEPSRGGGAAPASRAERRRREGPAATPRGGGESRVAGAGGRSAGTGAAAGGGKGGEGRLGRPPEGKGKKKERRPARQPRHRPREEGGAGGGMAAGTSRMGGSFSPVAHRWDTRDRGGGEDSGGDEEEDEIDEDRRRSRQRGGMQPSLRDRRPPPSRDLGLSRPGDEPGKGRGGPTPPKKSRGTAALILGRPQPDTVKGLPNPGSSKVQQRRTAPRPAPGEPPPGPQPAAAGPAEPPLGGRGGRPEEAEVVRRFYRILRGLADGAPGGSER